MKVLRRTFFIFCLCLVTVNFIGCNNDQQPENGTQKTAKEVVSRFYDLIDTQEIERYRPLFSDSCKVYFGSANSPVLIDEVTPFVKEHYKAFPNYKHLIQEMIVADNRVIVRVKYTGKHEGTFFQFEPSGNFIDYNGIFIFEVNNSLITSVWGIEDDLKLREQISESYKKLTL